jgi:hypothetical protein
MVFLFWREFRRRRWCDSRLRHLRRFLCIVERLRLWSFSLQEYIYWSRILPEHVVVTWQPSALAI